MNFMQSMKCMNKKNRSLKGYGFFNCKDRLMVIIYTRWWRDGNFSMSARTPGKIVLF